MSVPCEPEPHPIGDVRCVSIDIERCEKAGLISIPFKHVDELILCGNGAVFLIEHTGAPHEEDLEKLVETSARLGQLVPMLTGEDAPLRTTRRYYLTSRGPRCPAGSSLLWLGSSETSRRLESFYGRRRIPGPA